MVALSWHISERLTEFAENLISVVSTPGIRAFSGTHEQSLGMLGMHGTLEANNAMHNADCILAFGARFDDRVTNNVEKFCPDATIVHVDIDPTSISKTISAHIPIAACQIMLLNNYLMPLMSKMWHHDLSPWWNKINQWKAKKCLNYSTSDSVIKPQQVIESLYKHTNGDAYVTSDVGQHQMFAALYYPFDKPRRWINSGGLGTMGLVYPLLWVYSSLFQMVVACVTGDGSIQMNIQELSTRLQYNLPVKIISLNNRALGMVRQWQDMIYQSRHSFSYRSHCLILLS